MKPERQQIYSIPCGLDYRSGGTVAKPSTYQRLSAKCRPRAAKEGEVVVCLRRDRGMAVPVETGDILIDLRICGMPDGDWVVAQARQPYSIMHDGEVYGSRQMIVVRRPRDSEASAVANCRALRDAATKKVMDDSFNR